ncbi:MAG: GTPase ObgE [Candidatus Bipolaricaulia bacterium]
MFIDEVKIHVKAGDGGDGLISFDRLPRGRGTRRIASGGDGGSGGDVIFEATGSLNTLLNFRHQIHFRAENGGPGGSKGKTGRGGADRRVMVPVGTVVTDPYTGEVLAELTEPGVARVIATGGRGGRGNRRFKSSRSRRRAPRIRERGEAGEARWLRLELKLLADVGIVGQPNVGKSSLIARISAQRPKIADYPFTTLEPHLGVVRVGEFDEFVAVDIPGLIEGAHEGKGLGDRFLKHIERTSLVLHMIDVSGGEGHDPLDDYFVINEELRAFNPTLAEKPQIVVGNKIDLLEPEMVEAAVSRFAATGIELHPISVATGAGIDRLIRDAYQRVRSLRARARTERMAAKRKVYRIEEEEEPESMASQVRFDGEAFVVEGGEAERLGRRLFLDTEDALAYLYERLEALGVVAELQRLGIRPGEIVCIGDYEFEFQFQRQS